MIKINKPRFWDDKRIGIFAILLSPFSLIVFLFIFFKKNLSKDKRFKIPIICVGNIYIGGTGKTPASILLAKQLKSFGANPAILRKYYKNHEDEYNLIQNNFNKLIINKKREQGIIEAEKKGFKTIILDDGLQDYKIIKDLTVVCFNQNQKIGNGLIIPSGPLRESLVALKNVDIVLINGQKELEFEEKLLKINKNLEIYYSFYKPINIDEFKNHNLLAMAGIANPNNFFNLLEKNNLNIAQKLVFPDHYKFSKMEILEIIKKAKEEKLKIIMTEKDFYKLNDFKLNGLNYLKILLEIEDKKRFFDRIQKIYD